MSSECISRQAGCTSDLSSSANTAKAVPHFHVVWLSSIKCDPTFQTKRQTISSHVTVPYKLSFYYYYYLLLLTPTNSQILEVNNAPDLRLTGVRSTGELMTIPGYPTVGWGHNTPHFAFLPLTLASRSQRPLNLESYHFFDHSSATGRMFVEVSRIAINVSI